MPKTARGRGIEKGSIYRDLDGQLVCLLKIKRNLCTWVPLSDADDTRQVTHRDNFIRRFTPLKKNSELVA